MNDFTNDAVLRVLTEHFRPDDPETSSMTVAAVGSLLRKHLHPPRSTGEYPKAAALLESIASQGGFTVQRNSKDALAVFRTSGDGEAGLQSPVHSRRWIRTLRKRVWEAVVYASDTAEWKIHKETGEVLDCSRAGIESGAASWINLPHLSEEEDKDASEQFFEEISIDISDALDAALDSASWFRDIPESLPDPIATAWKRDRSLRVQGLVEQWRIDNGVPESLIYIDPIGGAASAGTKASTSTPPRDANDLKAALVNAASKLSVDELLAMSFPARVLVEVLRPDLLD